MIIRWGHFSDLHFQFGKKEFNTSDLRDKMIDKIQEYVTENGKFNYLLISGDVFHKGQNEEKNINEIVDYMKQIAKAAGCEMENIFISPGNHDLKRSVARKQNLDHVLADYSENNSLQYNGYYSIVVNDVCLPIRRLQHLINSRNKEDNLHYYVNLGEINLYVLNTAIFAGQTYPNEKNPKKDLEDKNLYICDQHLLDLKKAVSKKDKSKKLNIVLGHHGVECFAENEKSNFLNFLGDLKTDIYVCGHVHRSIIKTLDEAGGAYQCSCGGLFVDTYNSPSFIIGEYNDVSSEIMLKNYQYIKNVNAWRPSNSLHDPYNENGVAKWTPNRLENAKGNNMVKSKMNENKILKQDVAGCKFNEVKKISIGLDRDKDFIEIRERATRSITILGVGMSKLSKYALYGRHSLEKVSKKMNVNLMMFDPDTLEKNNELASMCEDFFGIGKFTKSVRDSYDILKEYCDKHNSDANNKYKINLLTYSTIPTMSAVIIDEETDNGEVVVEYFGYHCGQSRPLLLIQKNKEDGLFECIKEQINMLKQKCDVKTE